VLHHDGLQVLLENFFTLQSNFVLAQVRYPLQS
jgi:hypothetical protein